MPFAAEPSDDDLAMDSDQLHIQPVTPDDAAEAFDLLTHPDLTFVADGQRPENPEILAKDYELAQGRVHNTEDFRLYRFAARLKDTNELAAIVTLGLDIEATLQTQRDEAGKPVGVSSAEVRVAEATVYVHPDHQETGRRLGSEAVAAVQGIARDQFSCTVRRAQISLANEKSQTLAEASGMHRARPGDDGYAVWEGPLT